jgi:hypothetical protein
MKLSDADTLYEHTIVYVNNLVIANKDLQSWIIKLENDLFFKLKENGPLEFLVVTFSVVCASR